MHKVQLEGATRHARPFVVGVIGRRTEDRYTPLRERVWDVDAQAFVERGEQQEAA